MPRGPQPLTAQAGGQESRSLPLAAAQFELRTANGMGSVWFSSSLSYHSHEGSSFCTRLADCPGWLKKKLEQVSKQPVMEQITNRRACHLHLWVMSLDGEAYIP